MPEITDTQPRATPGTPSAARLRPVTGYDGTPPASRAIEAAITLLRGRHGSIDVVYVAHAPGADMLSPDVLVQVEAGFSEIEKELRSSAAAQLDGRGVAWEFQRQQGMIARGLIAATSAAGEAHPGDTVAIVVGSSSQAGHRIVGSVAVGLARHCPVPLVIVPEGWPAACRPTIRGNHRGEPAPAASVRRPHRPAPGSRRTGPGA